ncbi:hypothetical protein, partial [Streptomyces sp. NPDC058623]|uniref:hypothetical protein n=1 Tax=Streptomyces sp. NPDC058623 TaxID=3346563 RepID=UPI003657E7D0
MALNGTTMGDPPTGLTKVPNLQDDAARIPGNPVNAEKPRTEPRRAGAGLSHNDCSAASYSPTGSP